MAWGAARVRANNGALPVVCLWSLSLGIGQVAFWPVLPFDQNIAGMVLFLVFVLPLIVLVTGFGRVTAGQEKRPQLTSQFAFWALCLPFALGTGWALVANHQALAERLPLSLHGSDHRLTVEIDTLPKLSPAIFTFSGAPRSRGGALDGRFQARVIASSKPEFIDKRLLLSWYRLAPEAAERLLAGSHWELTVRLKRPRGSVNPNTFDYEAWLLQQGIFATGYVRDKDDSPKFVRGGSGIDALRERLRSRISGQNQATGQQAAVVLSQQGLIRALVLGDRGGVDADTQALLRRTGTAHLLAISGLHVGMVAGFFLLLGGLLSRALGVLRAHNPLYLAGGAALVAALSYTLLSGAPLSAQRALVMTAVAIGAFVGRRKVSASFAYALALTCVLLMQPLAVLNAGFWLSFIAVGALLLRFQGRTKTGGGGEPTDDQDRIGRTSGSHLIARFWFAIVNALKSQWVIFVGLLLPSILIFSGVSASGLVLNLIAIPWVGLMILPLILLGSAIPYEAVSMALWQLADFQLAALLQFLEVADRSLPGWQSIPVPNPVLVGMAVISCIVLLLPRGIPGRALAWCLIPVILIGVLPWQRSAAPYFDLTVLDVGQGLAVVAATEEHTLIYDTGANSGGGWSAGRDVVAPYLLGAGRQRVDALVVSHGDRDHAGGVTGVLEQLDVAQLFAPGKLPKRLSGSSVSGGSNSCVAGNREALGELQVSWLWPRSLDIDGEENDHSCVALLTWRGARVLLTGDISRKVEAQLAALYPEFSPVDLVVAPHHGSRTSSSSGLLKWAQPQHVVFSAGFRHHFGHPHHQVVERYRRAGSQRYNTAESGAIAFRWRLEEREEGPRRVLDIEKRRAKGRFWYTDHRDKKDNYQALSSAGELW